MINIIVTTKNAKPGSFMNLHVDAADFEAVKRKVRANDFLDATRLYVRKDNGDFTVTAKADITIRTSEIITMQVSDLPPTTEYESARQ